MHGPFVHALNKGGLSEIVRAKRLISTTAAGIAGGGDAVRAHQGSFADLYKFLRWGANPDASKTYVEFTTTLRPEISGPPAKHASVFWAMDAGKYLPIAITGVYNGLGAKIG